MGGFRTHRVLWPLLAALALGVGLSYLAWRLAGAPPGFLDGQAAALSRWREFLDRYGLWLHASAHGATYLYLTLRWPRLVDWIDRRRVEGGGTPLSTDERRRLAWAVVAICVACEGLLSLRYLG